MDYVYAFGIFVSYILITMENICTCIVLNQKLALILIHFQQLLIKILNLKRLIELVVEVLEMFTEATFEGEKLQLKIAMISMNQRCCWPKINMKNYSLLLCLL